MSYVHPSGRPGVRSPDTGHLRGRSPDGRLSLRLGLMHNGGEGQAPTCFFKEQLMASRRPPPDSPRIPTAATPTPTASTSQASPEKSPAARKPKAPRAKPVTAPATLTRLEISEDVRRGMIAEAAYLRAERRGFTGGPEKEREDWLAAEAAVDALLQGGHGSSAQ